MHLHSLRVSLSLQAKRSVVLLHSYSLRMRIMNWQIIFHLMNYYTTSQKEEKNYFIPVDPRNERWQSCASVWSGRWNNRTVLLSLYQEKSNEWPSYFLSNVYDTHILMPCNSPRLPYISLPPDVLSALQFGNTALSTARDNDVVQYLLQHQPKWKSTLQLLHCIKIKFRFDCL